MVDPNRNILQTRFLLNMSRIHGLLRVIQLDYEELKPSALFQSEGIRADILRSAVVFLHATFEDVVRSRIPRRKQDQKWNFYSGRDLDKALRLAEIEAEPFKTLYPTLTQLAKRRKRIVHNADLPTPAATISEPWQLADDWQLVMWLMAVSAFYYQLCVSVDAATIVEKRAHQNHMQAMHEWHNVAKAFIGFSKVPSDQRLDAIKQIADMVKKVGDILPLDRNALIAEIS
jgi:hypothetical protein